MTLLHRLKEWQTKEGYKKCTASLHKRKKRRARWYSDDGKYYCKFCAKKLWELLRVPSNKPRLSNKHFHRNHKSIATRIMNLRRKATRAELIFLKKLKAAIRLKFRFQRGFIKGGYYAIVDFHIPSRNLCIEIDGGYHDSPSQKSKDAHRDKWLREIRGQHVVRLSNERAETMTVTEVANLVTSYRDRKSPLILKPQPPFLDAADDTTPEERKANVISWKERAE